MSLRLRPPLPVAVACIVLFLGSPSASVQARPFRVDLIPNGEVLGCAACHIDPNGGGPRNPFGKAVEVLVTPGGREQVWGPAFAGQDSDGDGLTNGQELQDPAGSWKPESPPPGNPKLVTPPGIPNKPVTPKAPATGGEASETTTSQKSADHALPPSGGPTLEVDASVRLRREHNRREDNWNSLFYTNALMENIVQDHLDAKLSGWDLRDFDSDKTFGKGVDQRSNRVAEAWADLHGVGPITRLRLGRQYLYDVDYLHFDGAAWTIYKKKPLTFFAFGGRPVTYYESVSGDYVGGAGAIWEPTWRTRHQFDAYELHEGGESFTLSAWRWNRYWGNAWRSDTRLRLIDGGVRDFRAFLFKYFEPLGLDLTLNYYLQPKERAVGDETHSRSLASLGHILGPRAAYHQAGADVSRYFGNQWMAQVGGSVRRRIGSEGEDSLNSVESKEAHLSATRFDALVKNMDLTLGYEAITNEQDSMRGVTGNIGYHPDPRWQFNVGASYTRYRFDPIDFNTDLNGQDGQDDLDLLLNRLQSRVYFLETRWRPNPTYEFWVGADLADAGSAGGHGVGFQMGLNYHLRKAWPRKDGK